MIRSLVIYLRDGTTSSTTIRNYLRMRFHFCTIREGGPYFDAYKNCGYADLWFTERDKVNHADSEHLPQ